MGYIHEDELIQFPNQNNETSAKPGSYSFVETHIVAEDDDGEFVGRCEMLLPEEAMLYMIEFCLGFIEGTGTALIVGEEDKLYVYSSKDVFDLPWEKMDAEGTEGQILEIFI